MSPLTDAELARLSQSLLESSLQGIFLLQEGRLVYVNETLAQMLSLTRKEMLSWEPQRFLEQIHPDFREMTALRYQAREHGEEEPEQYEIAVLSRDGQSVWVEILAHRIMLESGPAVHGCLLDITERKKAEKAMRMSEERFRTMAQLLPDGIYEADAELRITYANRAAFEIFGYTQEDCDRGVFIAKLLVEDEIPRARQAFTEMTHGGVNEPHEYRMRRKDGGVFWGEVFSVPVYDGDRVTGFWGLLRDVTERKHREEEIRRHNEELARANRLKDDFLAAISHELRTPLTSVLGYAELLEHKLASLALPERLQKAPRHIANNARMLESLIDNLMDLALVSNGEIRYFFAPDSLNRVVEAAIDVITPQAGEKDIRVRAELDEKLPPVRMDPQRIEQVIWNLLSNAVKFSETGSDIIVRTARADGELRVSVEDRGPGIDPCDHELIFEVFRQAQGGLRRPHGGVGIGLALAKRFVEAHGGHIEVASEPGRGSIFSFALPLTASKATD